MLALLMALAVAADGDRWIAWRPVVEVTAEVVTLADAADLSNLPPSLQDRAAGIVLARLAPGASVEVAPGRLAERARAQVPVLAGRIRVEGPQVLLRRGPAANVVPPPSPDSCARVVRPIEGGAFIERDALEPAACGKQTRSAATWFDRSAGLTRAAMDLPEGTQIAAPPPAALARYAPGQAFTLSATVGPVRIERPVQAVRPAADGAVVVVRDADGKIHALAATEEIRP